MGVDYEIVLAAPHAPSYPKDVAEKVIAGLRDLGFVPVLGSSDKVWFSDRRFSRSIPGDPMDWLRQRVLELPWPASLGAAEHITVLWQNDFTMEDDSMAGRTSPYAWRQETWVVEPKKRSGWD